MGSPFHIREHVIDGQHIREYPRATAAPDATLKLSIKQYTPKDNLEPQPGDVTIIAAQGAAMPKELYEPLWEDMLASCKQNGVRIRAIWMADATNQGASGIINEQQLGNDPSWYDHSRDLIYMVNHFRDQMPRPIMGVGHSAGAVQLIFMSIFHPRLFSSLILVEPWLTRVRFASSARKLMAASTHKPDVWPSRDSALQRDRRKFKTWHPRVFERWAEYGYRELPTAIYQVLDAKGDGNSRPVTLATTKYQEGMAFTRLNLDRHIELGLPDHEATDQGPIPPHDPLAVPDMEGSLQPGQQSYRPEPGLVFKLLPYLRPSFLCISGSESDLYKSGSHAEAATSAGTGFSGSGGIKYDRVKHEVIEKGGHNLPLEKMEEVAEAAGPWIYAEMLRWQDEERRIAQGWENKPLKEKSVFPDGWMTVIGDLPPPRKQSKL